MDMIDTRRMRGTCSMSHMLPREFKMSWEKERFDVVCVWRLGLVLGLLLYCLVRTLWKCFFMYVFVTGEPIAKDDVVACLFRGVRAELEIIINSSTSRRRRISEQYERVEGLRRFFCFRAHFQRTVTSLLLICM